MFERKAKGKPKPLRLSGFLPTRRPCRGQIHFKSKKYSKKTEKLLTNLQNYGMLFLEQADTSEEHSACPLVSVNDQKIKKENETI